MILQFFKKQDHNVLNHICLVLRENNLMFEG
jgi:hypothetical protein